MNLRSEELEELNKLLANNDLQIPGFRRQVHSSGANYSWLQKNIGIKNPSLPARLKKLLNIK